MSPSNLCILHKFRFLNELVAISHGTMNSNIHRVYILIFVAFCLLSVIFKQWLKQHNYYFVQSELLTRLWTDFSSSIWNFCRCGASISPGKIPLMQGVRRDSCFCRLKKQLFENVFFLLGARIEMCVKSVLFVGSSLVQSVLDHIQHQSFLNHCYKIRAVA